MNDMDLDAALAALGFERVFPKEEEGAEIVVEPTPGMVRALGALEESCRDRAE